MKIENSRFAIHLNIFKFSEKNFGLRQNFRKLIEFEKKLSSKL